MATLPEGLTQSDIDRYAKLDAGIKALQEEHKVLGLLIKEKHAEAGITGKRTLIYEDVVVKLGEQRRLDEGGFLDTFPFSENPEFYSPAIDTAKVPADVLDTFRTIVIPTLSVSKAA